MPIVVPCAETAELELDEFVHRIGLAELDPSDQASMIEVAPLLKRLSNNGRFVGDFLIEQVKQGFQDQLTRNAYGHQVLFVVRISADCFFRANLWPSREDELYGRNGPGAYFYERPHDHNFNFLTVGHFGPGYVSDYYDYDAPVAGFPGERAPLRFVERRSLDLGAIFLYRANRDIHNQLPPESTSITLNIMDAAPHLLFRRQFMFDRRLETVERVVRDGISPELFNAAAVIGGDEAKSVLSEIARRHDDPQVRFHAIRAVAMASTPPGAEQLLSDAANSSNAVIAGWSRRSLQQLDTSMGLSQVDG